MTLERIQVHANGRFLATESGQPFFWLGDTAWELFHRLNRAEAEKYLDTRRQQGFNVIQAVALAECDGLRTPNANGHIPLAGDDPARPNEFYFRFVDEVIRLAAEKGLYVGLLPTWGDKVVGSLWGAGPVVFTPENALSYGKYLGQRYQNDTNVIWILGGDRPAEGFENIWQAMADGITVGLGRKPLFSYHPTGGGSSSNSLHEANWLGMNMLQSGHVMVDTPNWEMITRDYQRTPLKPVLDGEPNYEDHPIDPYLRRWQPSYGRFRAYDVRKQAYRSVFAGACGHTYGNHSVWQFWALPREPINFPMPAWDEAIFAEGAGQLIHLKNLILSRSYFNRVPAQEMLPAEIPPPAVGDLDADRVNPHRAVHPRATRAGDGSYAFVYIPQANQTVQVDLRLLAGPAHAAWYDPRSGQSTPIGVVANTRIEAFTTPLGGPDWVLILDSAGETPGDG